MVKLISLLIALPLMSQTPDLAQLQKMTARFAPEKLTVDTSKLSAADQKALAKLVEAAHVVDHLFLTQFWTGNQALYAKLQQDHSALGKARLNYFWMNKGPWSALDDLHAFLPDVPARKLAGANFYPPDMTKDEFETWAYKLSKPEQELAQGFFSVIIWKSPENCVNFGFRLCAVWTIKISDFHDGNFCLFTPTSIHRCEHMRAEVGTEHV